ncbi:MAG TPA: hypothetical protein PLK94_03805 [Alphaproteobacteria bacterium]|nr:hypothetical protein [Alphaproteobacteria bacterium]HPR55457.1 hypothetical protein [Deltaproteobacteria bacterium]
MFGFISKLWQRVKPITELERVRDRNEKTYQQYFEELKSRNEKFRREAKDQLSGRELEYVLRRLDELETLDRKEFEARNNPRELKRILKRRLNELHEHRIGIETKVKGQKRGTALRKTDEYETYLHNRIDELDIYENPPGQFPKEPGIKDQLHMLKVLKNGTPQEKKEVFHKMSKESMQTDALRRSYQEKLMSPIYRQEIISSYKTRSRLFTICTLLLLAFAIGSTVMASDIIRDNAEIFIPLMILATLGIYVYLGTKLYRCPACGYKLDFLRIRSVREGRSKMNMSTLSSCPRCGSPFR